MTVTLALTEYAQAIFGTTTIQPPGNAITVDTFPQAGLYRYQLSRNIMFNYPLQFTATLTGSGTFFVLVLSDPDSVSALINGIMDPTQVPSAYSSISGSAASAELARQTFTTSGSKTFDLDLGLVTPIISTSTQFSGGWNGSLLLWLCCSSGAGGSWLNPTLTAFGIIDRANRDTGRSQAPEGSRMDRCPVTGLMVSRQRMVLDGYRGIYVHPIAWDPAEPEPYVWGEYPDPNEGGGT